MRRVRSRGVHSVRYSEWMSSLVRRRKLDGSEDSESLRRSQEISDTVRKALNNLTEREKIAVEKHHFMGIPVEIAALQIGVTERGLERILRRARLKLQAALYDFVEAKWDIPVQSVKRMCPICESVNCKRADELIATKQPKETWRRIITKLRDDLNITVRSPQSLIGHVRYHGIKSVHPNSKGGQK